jgi:Protein of unknown function (DUF4242)
MAHRPRGIVDAMPTYLVERYLPGRDRAWLEAALARLPRERSGVAYLGSTYVPADDSCFCRFEAETADDVRDANDVARVPFARIVAATELGVGETVPHQRRRSIMKRSLFLLLAIAAAGVIATASSANGHGPPFKPQKGALHVTKTCGDYHGAVGEFCTIRSSNIDVIEPDMQVVYLQALSPGGTLDSDLVISAGHGSVAVGHVVLNGTTSQITFLGGTGEFDGFHANAVVSVDGTGLWHWDGTYSFTPR